MDSEKKNASLPLCEAENLASAAECTGLIPAAVQTDAEGESYAAMYAIHQQKPVRKEQKECMHAGAKKTR